MVYCSIVRRTAATFTRLIILDNFLSAFWWVVSSKDFEERIHEHEREMWQPASYLVTL